MIDVLGMGVVAYVVMFLILCFVAWLTGDGP